jgi:hypothetical protein
VKSEGPGAIPGLLLSTALVKPHHPMTQGKVERWHLSLKSRILLANYYLPGDLERAVAAFANIAIPAAIARAWTI